MAKRKKSGLSASLTMIIMVLAVVTVITVVLGALLLCDFFFMKPDDGRPAVFIFVGEKKLREVGESEAFMQDGIMLINLNTLSEHCKYGVAGDTNSRTAVFPDGSYAAFTPGASFCLNGENCFLPGSCVMRGDSFFVPLSFFEEYVSGLKFSTNDDKTRLYIDVASSNYQLKSYSTSPEITLSASDYFDAVNYGRTAPEFKTDLSAYEEYMNPVDKDKYLFLINTSNLLDRDYVPQNLTDLIHTRKDGRTTQQLELYAAKAMEAMLKEAAAHGYTSLSITSAYRSFNYQQLLFDNQVAALTPSYGEKAREKAAQAVAIPGSSEHQSGLCADLHNLPSASQKFADTPEYRWLYENCAKFGFILRYPKNKTEITGIMFEPWHYRYVGRYHAERIMQEGLCLEEYVKLLS